MGPEDVSTFITSRRIIFLHLFQFPLCTRSHLAHTHHNLTTSLNPYPIHSQHCLPNSYYFSLSPPQYHGTKNRDSDISSMAAYGLVNYPLLIKSAKYLGDGRLAGIYCNRYGVPFNSNYLGDLRTIMKGWWLQMRRLLKKCWFLNLVTY